ncbi:CLUMA_CG006274, isoform B [Clunio marinus]|uniref:Snurportin-1 n=1 Tax=Clunio marinus TaxID=568069 RepID=A0A1J1HXF7_9DIPT|nr:CLUMA_CG006274, isoform B [Clunio marinus]
MESNYKDLYKKKILLKEQQMKRRKELLEIQKRRRDEMFISGRESVKTPQEQSFKKKQLKNRYTNIIMLSEFMISLPEDIENFTLIPCPKGVRCSLVTEESKHKKYANLFNKKGKRILNFKTNIPPNTILDCIFSMVTNTIYILDIIAYNNHDMSECEAFFRLFWIKSKFLEDELHVLNDGKQLKLELLSNYDFSDPHTIKLVFETYAPFKDGAELDGYLFYHKECLPIEGSYTAGETPLVLWLFPFMVNELFESFKVHEFYYSQRPENYTNHLLSIEEYFKKTREKHGNFDDEMMNVQDKKMCDQIALPCPLPCPEPCPPCLDPCLPCFPCFLCPSPCSPCPPKLVFETYAPFKDGTELDGYLFYHKEGSYIAGETPLVLWLFPFMVNELFESFKVHEFYYSQRPENYTNHLVFIEEYFKKTREKHGNFDDEMMNVQDSENIHDLADN